MRHPDCGSRYSIQSGSPLIDLNPCWRHRLRANDLRDASNFIETTNRQGDDNLCGVTGWLFEQIEFLYLTVYLANFLIQLGKVFLRNHREKIVALLIELDLELPFPDPLY